MVFKIFNTRIKIDYLLFVLISTCILFEYYEIFDVLLFCVLHELGHLLILIIFNQNIEMINFTYYGIAIKFVNRLSHFKEFLYLFWGLFVNFIFVLLNVKTEINMALLFINVIPIYPLDGGRILKIVLNSIFSYDIALVLLKIISISCLFTILFFGITIKNVSLILISIYSFIFCLNNSFD